MVPGRGLAVWRCGIHKEHRVAKNLRGDRKRAGCGARARSAGVAQASAGALATAQAAWRGASAAGLGGTGGPGAVTSLWLGGEGRWQDRVRRPFRDRELAVTNPGDDGPERGSGAGERRRAQEGRERDLRDVDIMDISGTWRARPGGSEDSPTRPARAVAGGDGLHWDAGPGERSVHCSGTEAPRRHPHAVGPTSRELRLGGAGRAGVGLDRQHPAERSAAGAREPAEARLPRGQAGPPRGGFEGRVTGDIRRPHWCRTAASPQPAGAAGTRGARPGH